MASLSGPPSHTGPAVPPVFLASQGPGNSMGVSITSGSDGIICTAGASGPPAQAQVSAPLQGPLVSGPPPLGSPHPTGRVVSGVHQPVEQDRMALSGGSHHASSPPGTPVHGRLSGGLGSTCGLPHSLRPLAGEHDVLSHQPSGTGGCFSCAQTVSPLSDRQDSPPPHGQHDRGMLHQQARGSPFSTSLTENGGASSVVLQPVHPVVSPVCSGQVEHSGRPPQSTTHGLAVGMDSCALSAQADLVSLVHSSHRPLCHWVQSSPASVCVPSSRPGSLSIPWSNLLSYAFPPISIIGKVLRKARDESATLILVPPHWPAQALFPELLHLCHVPPIRLSLGPRSLLQPRSRVPHGNPGVLHLHAWLLCGTCCLH